MRTRNVINLLLICWGVFVTGVSLTLLTPFYPTEALAKVRVSLRVSETQNSVNTTKVGQQFKKFYFPQGVTVTQSGVVLSTVFIATLIFTPIFGKEFINILT